MSEDADYQYALELQRRLNADQSDDEDVKAMDFKAPTIINKQKLQAVKRSNPHSNLDEDFLNRTQNLVHPMWETLDPTPDVNALFGAFDGKFFQGRLKCVTLEWSKKMYSCAGICYSSKNRFGMSITIRLSEPLLKLRPRKDLVETMLHEMIHAYCFVLNIREGNGGHGPQFKKIMMAINKVAGTNITVYHSFHDEVNLYKQHWWRCNGCCQNRSPFFGYVKRTSNRAPSPNDQWWAAHMESCGGTFLKIKEPEPKRKKTDKAKSVSKTALSGTGDIRKFFNGSITESQNKTGKPTGSSFSGVKGPIKSNGGGTLLLNPKTSLSTVAKAFPPTSYPGLSSDPFNTNIANGSSSRNKTAAPGGNLRNVVGFRDLNDHSGGSGGGSTGNRSRPSSHEMIGQGFSVGATSSPLNTNNVVDRKHLREVWSKRFGNGSIESANEEMKKAESPCIDLENDKSKRRRISKDIRDDNKNWELIDDDIMLREQPTEIVTLSSSDDDTDNYEDDGNFENNNRPSIVPKKKPLTAAERQSVIKQEILDETNDLTDDDIILIDDEYDDNMKDHDSDFIAATNLADISIIDEFFSEDTLLKDFITENDVRPTFSRNVPNPENDIITCPVCQNKLRRSDLEEHLNGCTGIAIRVLPPKSALKKLAATAREVKQPRQKKQSKKDILRAAGYTEEDLKNICNSSTEDEQDLSTFNVSLNLSPEIIDLNESVRSERLRNVYKTTRQCPVCAQEIEEDEINEHLDECLSNR